MTESNQANLTGANRPIQIIPSVLPADGQIWGHV